MAENDDDDADDLLGMFASDSEGEATTTKTTTQKPNSSTPKVVPPSTPTLNQPSDKKLGKLTPPSWQAGAGGGGQKKTLNHLRVNIDKTTAIINPDDEAAASLYDSPCPSPSASDSSRPASASSASRPSSWSATTLSQNAPSSSSFMASALEGRGREWEGKNNDGPRSTLIHHHHPSAPSSAHPTTPGGQHAKNQGTSGSPAAVAGDQGKKKSEQEEDDLMAMFADDEEGGAPAASSSREAPAAGSAPTNIPGESPASSTPGAGLVIPPIRHTKDVLAMLKQANGRKKISHGIVGGVTKARSAYAIFSQAQYKDGFKGKAKAMYDKWLALDEKEQEVYYEKASADKDRFQDEVKTYFGEKGQDLMSILVQCTTDNAVSRKRKRETNLAEDAQKEREAEKIAAINALSGGDDGLNDLFGGGNGDEANISKPEVNAPQLRLDAFGKIILDQASLQAQNRDYIRGPTTASTSAKPYENAYKKAKRVKWSEEEDSRFWKAVSIYGSDLMLIQTLFREKTARQIKCKFKLEETRDPHKMNDHLYGDKQQKFTRELFEEQFGKIDTTKHFVAPVEDEIGTIVEGKVDEKNITSKDKNADKKVDKDKSGSGGVATSSNPDATTPEKKDVDLNALLDLFD